VPELLDGALDEIQEAVLEPLTPRERKTLARLLACSPARLLEKLV